MALYPSSLVRLIKRLSKLPGIGEKTAERLALHILSREPLLLFPQGTRSDSFDSIKAGAGFLYKKTKVPVIAARVYGTADVLPRGAKSLQRGKIRVVFDKVAELDPQDSREAIAAKIAAKIQNL